MVYFGYDGQAALLKLLEHPSTIYRETNKGEFTEVQVTKTRHVSFDRFGRAKFCRKKPFDDRLLGRTLRKKLLFK